MSRLTLAVALAALLGCAATTTSTPQGTTTAIGLAPGASDNSSSKVWVCHGHKKPKWKHVASPAVDAHRQHGDRISYTHQLAKTSCTR